MIVSATAGVGKQNCITRKSTTFEYNVMYMRIPRIFIDVISIPREKHSTQSTKIFGNDNNTHVYSLYLYYQYII